MKYPKDKTPSVLDQTKWRCGFFDFGKAGGQGIRYFNPAIIDVNGTDWLYARCAKDCAGELMGLNNIVAFQLEDKSHRPLAFQTVRLENRNYKKQHFEDPRIGIIGGKLWLSYATFQVDEKKYSWTGAHQGVAVLGPERDVEQVIAHVYGANGGSILTGSGIEKNWLWFEHDGNPHMIYMTEPHEVVRWDQGKVAEVYIKRQVLPWMLGHPRGGSNPVRVGSEYWSFFHSSTDWREFEVGPPDKRHTVMKRRYHMGAYAFEAKPPFRIKWMTHKPLLSGSWNDPWQEVLPLVVFPCGATYKNGLWCVSYGVNDYCSGWIEIPHTDLGKLVVKVS